MSEQNSQDTSMPSVTPDWVETARALYDRCKLWPEETADGMTALLELRNHVSDLLNTQATDAPKGDLCPVCFEDEPHTGTCGSNSPRAWCNRAAPPETSSVRDVALEQAAQLAREIDDPDRLADAIRALKELK